MAPLKAVAFDIDGTLYPNQRMYMLSTKLLVKNLKLFRAFYTVRRELRRIRPIHDFYATQTNLVAEKLGKNPEEIRDLITKEFYTKWEKIFYHVHLYPDAIRTLSWLKKKGILLGVLSDFPVEMKLNILDITDYFDVALCSESVGYLKPAAEPFHALLERLDVNPQNLLYVGNNYDYDVIGAHNLGIRTAHISRRAPSGSLADFTFSRYADLLAWIKEQT